jgi:hypothetical protein
MTSLFAVNDFLETGAKVSPGLLEIPWWIFEKFGLNALVIRYHGPLAIFATRGMNFSVGTPNRHRK